MWKHHVDHLKEYCPQGTLSTPEPEGNMDVDFLSTSTSSDTRTHSSGSSNSDDQNDASRMNESPNAPSSLETPVMDSASFMAEPSSDTSQLNYVPYQYLSQQRNPPQRFSEFQS